MDSIDADTKLVISYMLGQRGLPTAMAFMKDLSERVANRFQLTTDGHRVYADAVEEHFGCDIGYAMLVKIYGESTGVTETEARYRTTSVKDVMRWACPGMLCCIRPGTRFNGSRRSRSRCVYNTGAGRPSVRYHIPTLCTPPVPETIARAMEKLDLYRRVSQESRRSRLEVLQSRRGVTTVSTTLRIKAALAGGK